MSASNESEGPTTSYKLEKEQQAAGTHIPSQPGLPTYDSILTSTENWADDLIYVLENRYDTLFLIDDSNSMSWKGGYRMEGDTQIPVSRWDLAREALLGIAKIAVKHDKNGIDIEFLNSTHKGKNIKRVEDVERIFRDVQPSSGTPTRDRLDTILGAYYAQVMNSRSKKTKIFSMLKNKKVTEPKPLNVLIITDGQPNHDPSDIIIKWAEMFDKAAFDADKVGIQFVQIGDDKNATLALNKMDDELGNSEVRKRDMVDTYPFSKTQGMLTPEILTKILLGGVHREQDRVRPEEIKP